MRQKRWPVVLAAATGLWVLAGSAASQPPSADEGQQRTRENRRGGLHPPRPTLGSVIPPFARDRLGLSVEQQRQIADLEKEVKARLTSILTDEQRRQLEQIMRQGPPGASGRRSRGGDGGGPAGAPPPDNDEPRRPRAGGNGKPPAEATQSGGIQWFATLKTGLAEARKTGRPVLFVAAAPHCGGVPGIW